MCRLRKVGKKNNEDFVEFQEIDTEQCNQLLEVLRECSMEGKSIDNLDF